MKKCILYFLAFCFSFPIFAQKEKSSSTSPLPNHDHWWQLWEDHLLISLINQAIAHNYNLQSAMTNIDIAKTEMRIERSGLFPEFSTSVEYSSEKDSKGIEQETGYHRIGQGTLQMNWEIDVFGRVRKNIKTQQRYYEAAQEDYRGVMVSLAAEIANAYIQLRTYQQELKITQQNLVSQQEILRLNEIKAQTGLGSQLAVAQARSLWLETQANLPNIESSIYQQTNILLTLIGTQSDSLRQQLLSTFPLPKIKPVPIKGIPAELLRQRPDIRAAEKNLEALAAAVGASRADWWPQFYINGTIGYGNTYFKHFFKSSNMTWQITPTIQWTIFKGKQISENQRLAKLKLDEGVENYNQTLLTALKEIDNALFAYHKAQQQLQATQEAFEQIRLTFEYAMDLYNKGLTSYQNVLDSQRQVLSYENQVLNAENTTLLSFIQLYKALGGGFYSQTL